MQLKSYPPPSCDDIWNVGYINQVHNAIAHVTLSNIKHTHSQQLQLQSINTDDMITLTNEELLMATSNKINLDAELAKMQRRHTINTATSTDFSKCAIYILLQDDSVEILNDEVVTHLGGSEYIKKYLFSLLTYANDLRHKKGNGIYKLYNMSLQKKDKNTIEIEKCKIEVICNLTTKYKSYHELSYLKYIETELERLENLVSSITYHKTDVELSNNRIDDIKYCLTHDGVNFSIVKTIQYKNSLTPINDDVYLLNCVFDRGFDMIQRLEAEINDFIYKQYI